jgi:hypothetical protein
MEIQLQVDDSTEMVDPERLRYEAKRFVEGGGEPIWG